MKHSVPSFPKMQARRIELPGGSRDSIRCLPAHGKRRVARSHGPIQKKWGRNKTVATLSGKFLDQTIHLWQPRLGRSLSQDDARHIAGNVVGFFQLLDEWDKAEQQTAGSIGCNDELETTPSALPQNTVSHKLDETSNGTEGAPQ